VDVIEREISSTQVMEGRQKLFSHYDTVTDKSTGNLMKDQKRNTPKGYIKDVVMFLAEIDKKEELDHFVIPWDYKVNPLTTDADKRATLIVEENNLGVKDKIDDLEKRLEAKNKDFQKSILTLIENMLNQKNENSRQPTYADRTVHGAVGGGGGAPQPLGGHAVGAVGGGGGFPQLGQSSGFGRRIRDRSPSTKRARGNDGTEIDSDDGRRPVPKTRKYVVGTFSTVTNASRKMKSPPADIFVYGVHPDTTEEDIVNDLKENEIIVDQRHVVKKSKPEASLNSFKISVKAEDLPKVLDPAVWPLRVKVREWIYFSRKSTKQEGAAGAPAQQRGQAGHHHAGDQAPKAKVPEIVINEHESVESYNKFNHLRDEAAEGL
jgi:hypothetical protein